MKLVLLPTQYGEALAKYILYGEYCSLNKINDKVFEFTKEGVRIYYPDGVIRFISNTWEGEMFV